MDVKWFVIGIAVGFGIAVIIGVVIVQMFPYTSIEDVCFEQTFTAEEYEECLRTLRESD